MSNHTVPASAEGLPALALVGLAASAGACPHAALLASIPTWMELRIEAHRDALKALGRTAREVVILGDAALVIGRQNPPSWLLEAEQAHDTAQDRERDALTLLLAEQPRSDRDATARAVYLAGLVAHADFAADRRAILGLLVVKGA